MQTSEVIAFGARANYILSAGRGIGSVLALLLLVEQDRLSERSYRAVVTMFNWRIDAAFACAVTLVLLLGYHLVGDGVVTVGAATTAVLFFLRLQGPVCSLMSVIDTLQLATASLARIVGVSDIAGTYRTDGSDGTDSGDSTGSRPVEAGERAELDRVTFAYDGGPEVLHQITVTIDPGEHRADQPGDPHLRRHVARQPHPRGTAGRRLPRAWALREAGALDLLAQLPDGLDTDLGPAGATLTVAQSQHIALVRVLRADPELAILDEATAEAGSAHAHLLDRAAEAALAGRSGMVIAHRLSQAAVCDRIVVMERGRVIEDGSHTDLLAAGGQYSRLWAAQTAH